MTRGLVHYKKTQLASVGVRTRSVVGLEFCRDETVWSFAVAHQHRLVRPELGEAAAPKRFHMDKNIGRLRTGKKAKPVQSIEPFYHRSFPVAFWSDNDMGAMRQLRRMDGHRIVH